MFRLMVADVDSPSYFVATAAADLGFFKEEGVDIEFELVYGAKSGPERLRDGTVHFWWSGLRSDPGVPGLEGCQTSVFTLPIFILVHGRSRRSRCQTW